jgi:membrane protein
MKGLTAKLGGLTMKELAQRTWKEVNEDQCFTRAAALAFYFLLSLFPLLIFLLNLISFIPDAQKTIFVWLRQVMPADAIGLLNKWVEDIFSNNSGGLLSFGLLFALWSAANGMSALMEALNIAYDVKEGRAWRKSWLVALGLTITLSLLVLGSVVLLTFGDMIADRVTGWLGYEAAFNILLRVARYLVGLAMLLLGIGVIYYAAPNVKKRWRWLTPGAVFAVVSIIVVSFLFSIYLRFAPSYAATYGSIGAVIILILWLYLTGLILVIGSEINSEIDKAKGKIPIVKEEPQHKLAA